MLFPRKKILKLDISIGKRDTILNHIQNLASSNSPSYVCFINVHMSIEAVHSKQLANKINHSTLSLADGVPLVHCIKWFYNLRQERLAGMDILPECITLAAKSNLSIFFYGSSEAILSQIVDKTIHDYPEIKIAGKISPPFRNLSEEELQKDIDIINNSKANIVFVALGCPKQEKWMAENSHKINAVLLGIGGALEVYAGVKNRAPKWMQDLSLEWLFRFIQEPKRLFKRYLITNTTFIILIIKEYFKIKILGFKPLPQN